jgi:hypothetical protein
MPLKRVTTEITEVVTVNASVLGITTFGDFELVLKLLLLILSIGYTIARWRTHCNNNRK